MALVPFGDGVTKPSLGLNGLSYSLSRFPFILSVLFWSPFLSSSFFSCHYLGLRLFGFFFFLYQHATCGWTGSLS